jgi:hypothetical protein
MKNAAARAVLVVTAIAGLLACGAAIAHADSTGDAAALQKWWNGTESGPV